MWSDYSSCAPLLHATVRRTRVTRSSFCKLSKRPQRCWGGHPASLRVCRTSPRCCVRALGSICEGLDVHVNPAACLPSFTPPPKKKPMCDWINGHQMRRTQSTKSASCAARPLRRTDSLSAAASVTSDKLVWLSDAIMREDGARTTREYYRIPSLLFRLMRTACEAGSPYLSSTRSWSACVRPNTDIPMPQTPPMPIHVSESGRFSKVCPSTDHACCFHTAERGGARGPWRRSTSGSWGCHLGFLRANQRCLSSNRRSVTLSKCILNVFGS